MAVVFGVYYFKNKTTIKSSSSQSETLQTRADDMKVFFDYAKEKLPKLPQEIEELKRKPEENKIKLMYAQDELKGFKIPQIIADRNLNALKEATPEQLSVGVQIWVKAERFKDQMEGRLSSRIVGAQNALGIVILHSAMDKTDQDKANTLEMLRILLDKKLDLNAIVGDVYWVKDDPKKDVALDYVANYSLVESALIYSYPVVLEFLLKHGATFNKPMVNYLLSKMKEQNAPYTQEFENIIKHYAAQGKE